MADRRWGILPSLRRVLAFREFALIVVLIVMGIAMAFASPVFLDVGNLQAILLSLSFRGIGPGIDGRGHGPRASSEDVRCSSHPAGTACRTECRIDQWVARGKDED